MHYVVMNLVVYWDRGSGKSSREIDFSGLINQEVGYQNFIFVAS